MPDDYSKRDPEHKVIYRFVRNLFNAAQLTAECAIVTLVSLNIVTGTFVSLNIVAETFASLNIVARVFSSHFGKRPLA